MNRIVLVRGKYTYGYLCTVKPFWSAFGERKVVMLGFGRYTNMCVWDGSLVPRPSQFCNLNKNSVTPLLFTLFFLVCVFRLRNRRRPRNKAIWVSSFQPDRSGFTVCMYTLKLLHCLASRVLEGATNNLPDSDAHYAAREILALCHSASQGEVVVALISGGGSALLPCPIEGVKLDDKCTVTT